MLGGNPEQSLRIFRKKLKISQADFGRAIYPESDWGPQRVCDIEHGRRPMSPLIFARVKIAFPSADWADFFHVGRFK